MPVNDDNHQDKRKRTARSSALYPLGRRDAIKLLGAGVAGSAFPEMARSATVPAVRSKAGTTLAMPPNVVDVFVTASSVIFNTSSPGATGNVAVTVGNFGPNATLGPVQVLVGTPFFANIDESRLPPVVAVLFKNPQPNIPEIAQMTVPAGLPVGSTMTFSVPLVLADTPTPVPNRGWAIANVDAVDVEANPGDNSTSYEVRMPESSGISQSGNPVNLFFTFMKAELLSGETTNLPVTIGLQSGQLQGDPMFTFVTPYLTKLNPSLLQPLPANTNILFNPSNAGAVPQVVVTRVDRTLLNLLRSVTVNFPLQPTSASGPPTRFGKGLVVPAPNSGDFDPDPRIALSGLGIIQAR